MQRGKREHLLGRKTKRYVKNWIWLPNACEQKRTLEDKAGDKDRLHKPHLGIQAFTLRDVGTWYMLHKVSV